MWGWTGVTVADFEILMAACTLFLRTTTNVGKPTGPEAAGTPGSCRHNLCFQTHTRAAFGRQGFCRVQEEIEQERRS